jgi:hypothetical protein
MVVKIEFVVFWVVVPRSVVVGYLHLEHHVASIFNIFWVENRDRTISSCTPSYGYYEVKGPLGIEP